ncbi:putative histone-lysine N-methyltransferase 2A-like 2, partial [Homarus americanus]
MAKFRFPGKALKLNTRKRVRFRGSYAANTPEELYTRRIRRGLDLFTQIFGDSDEDEDGFEGFLSSCPEPREVRTTETNTPELPRRRGGKRAAQKVEEACAVLENEGLVTRRRTSVVEMAVKEIRVSAEKKKDLPVSGGRTDKEAEQAEPVSDIQTVSEAPPSSSSSSIESDQCVEGTKTMVVATMSHLSRKQTNHRISRPPTVKTALAKKLLAKAKKKAPSLPVVGEKSPKRFILPTMSVRSSRIIKPNKRLFADITEMCSTSSSLMADGSPEAGEDSISVPSKRLVKLTRKGRGSHTQFLSLPRSRAQGKNSLSGTEGVGRDRMRRTISRYTESITGPCKGQVGRPPKRLLRRFEAPLQEDEAELPDSPQRCDPKESRVKEKIEKLLRSPWDDRLKQTGK